jgi:sugar phosphate isomerase/epimerase
VERTAVLGAPHIRVFAGGTQNQPLRTARKLCIEALEECGDFAARHGVLLGLENHGGIVSDADGLLEIIRSADSPGLGISLDTGNFHTDDPYADLTRCAPYAVNVQLKANIRPGNGPSRPADLERLTRILHQANYQGYVALEYEEENPWDEVPRLLNQLKTLFRA